VTSIFDPTCLRSLTRGQVVKFLFDLYLYYGRGSSLSNADFGFGIADLEAKIQGTRLGVKSSFDSCWGKLRVCYARFFSHRDHRVRRGLKGFLLKTI
jgi:hypothetical protein